MNGQGTGYKTLGCCFALMIVVLAFYGMLAKTEQVAQHIKARRAAATTGRLAAQNLEAITIVLRTYTIKNGDHLPPLETPERLHDALVPKYLADTSVLVDPRAGKPYIPNAAVSGKTIHSLSAHSATTFLLGEPMAGPDGTRYVLFVNGNVRSVPDAEWTTLLTAK